MERTLDPQSNGAAVGASSKPMSSALLLVLFHADLRRVGDVHVLGPADVDAPASTTIGRDLPAFVGGSGHRAPLGDPCISRQQLAIRYLASPARFEVIGAPDARRPLSLWTMDGAPHPAPLASAPPDSILAIGDRLLLWLGVLPDEPGGDDLGIVGASAACRQLRRQIRALADASTTLLIRGETGTGKELVARALHRVGPRARAPFVAVNCAAIPEPLIESELFGHRRGAFSGASQGGEGLFRAAGDGTLLLDEIGELSATAQAKLLRTLQERTVRAVGDVHEHAVEARILAATHRALEAEVAAGQFRADLLARIEAPSIAIAPLRERRVDIPLLFVHFLARAATASGGRERVFSAATAAPPPLPMEAMLRLLGHAWPRNVRELEKHAVVAELGFRTDGRWPAPPAGDGDGDGIEIELGSRMSRRAAAAGRSRPTAEELVRLLDEHEHVARRVADQLGVSRTTLDKWMRELAVRRPADIGDDELQAALVAHGEDLARTAATLRISVRGLKLRLRERRPRPS